MKPVAILCGRHDQYREWIYSLTRNCIPKESLACIVRPVMNERDCHGAEFSNYFIYGTFWNRPDAQRLVDLVRSRIR